MRLIDIEEGAVALAKRDERAEGEQDGDGDRFLTFMGFLGLGAQPPTPEWGVMISEGRNYISTQPWLSLFPGLAILLAVGVPYAVALGVIVAILDLIPLAGATIAAIADACSIVSSVTGTSGRTDTIDSEAITSAVVTVVSRCRPPLPPSHLELLCCSARWPSYCSEATEPLQNSHPRRAMRTRLRRRTKQPSQAGETLHLFRST